MKPDRPLGPDSLLIHRHGALVRLTHWVNAASILVLMASGLQILCAHPAFYLGEVARFAHPVASIETITTDAGEVRGVLKLFGASLDVTGVLGASPNSEGQMITRAFPSWSTLPAELDLGAGRRWHFFFAWLLVLNGALYLVSGVATRRLSKELVPTPEQWRGIGRDILDHLRLRFPKGDEARHYNVLQRLTYLVMVLGVLPLMVITGLAMSPTIDAVVPVLTTVLGGRQTARTLHFAGLIAIGGFVFIHLSMVVLAGPLNLLRSMITGWMVIRTDEASR
jgi:thiosulfate reductase cytochrome b subunit